MLCWSCDLIPYCIGVERGDNMWNRKLFCDLCVDSIRSLLVSLNAIKRTQLLKECNTVKPVRVHFVTCPKNRVLKWRLYFCPKQGQDFKPIGGTLIPKHGSRPPSQVSAQ